MSSFTSRPVVYLPTDDSGMVELFSGFTYYRNPILRPDGSVKPSEEYTAKEKHLRTVETIIVPAGFKSDGASVPKGITWVFPRIGGRYTKAAILHDYMYVNRIGSKAEADLVFYEACRVLGLNKTVAKLFHWGVKLLGKGNY